MKEVLNTDYIFQIGNYLIKIDLANDRGLVIAAENSNAYEDLVNNNLSAPGMMALDGDEDFGLELLSFYLLTGLFLALLPEKRITLKFLFRPLPERG